VLEDVGTWVTSTAFTELLPFSQKYSNQTPPSGRKLLSFSGETTHPKSQLTKM